MMLKQLPTMISELNKLGIALKALDRMNLATVGVNTENLDAFRSAIKGLSTEQAVFALASKGATEEQIRQILITKQSEAADVEAALAKAGLTTATSALTQAEMVELATKTGVAKADAEALLLNDPPEMVHRSTKELLQKRLYKRNQVLNANSPFVITDEILEHHYLIKKFRILSLSEP